MVEAADAVSFAPSLSEALDAHGELTVSALVTVIIVNYNGAHLLSECLDALAHQDLGAGRWVTWVVDNASRDASGALLASRYPDVRVFANHRNDGFAGGNNLALRHVQTPFVALLNSDARPEPGWLRGLLAPFFQSGAQRLAATTSKVLLTGRYASIRVSAKEEPVAGLDRRRRGVLLHAVRVDGRDVTAKLLGQAGSYGPEPSLPAGTQWLRPIAPLLVPVADPVSRVHIVELVVSASAAKRVAFAFGGVEQVVDVTSSPRTVELSAAAGDVDPAVVVNSVGSEVLCDGHGIDRGYQQVDEGQYEEPADVFAFCGAAACLRTSAGREAGWFDERFFLYYEDTDLSWRLRRAGWTIRYEPSAVVWHAHAATSRVGSPLFVFHVARNRLMMLIKNASAPLAGSQCARYVVTTGSLAVRAFDHARRTGRTPALGVVVLRMKAGASVVRWLPSLMVSRRQLERTARISRAAVEARCVRP